MTSTPERIALSQLLKAVVRAKGISQKSIALEADVHESTVSRWLDDDNGSLPDALELASICRLVGIDPGELLAPLGTEGKAEPNLLRLWGLLLSLSPDQRGRLAEFLESLFAKAGSLVLLHSVNAGLWCFESMPLC